MEIVASGKRRRPASPPPPHQPPSDDEYRWAKKRRLEPIDAKLPEPCRPELESKKPSPTGKLVLESVDVNESDPCSEPEPKKFTITGKRRRCDSTEETSNSSDEARLETKRRHVIDSSSASSPPPDLPASPPANLSQTPPKPATETKDQEKREEKQEEKARFPPSPIIIPSQLEEDDVFKENRATSNVDEIVPSSQGSDADLVEACNNLDRDLKGSQDSLYTTVQSTPPPSGRMLDKKNPPPPPKRPKRHRNNIAGILYVRRYPRLALSPLVDQSPPGSPRVFRSLEHEFAFAMQDTPEYRPRVRPAPRMARGTRRSTRAGGSSGTRRSLDTPTSTMVLRSRQLNPSLSADGGKPENQREREQRERQQRQQMQRQSERQ